MDDDVYNDRDQGQPCFGLRASGFRLQAAGGGFGVGGQVDMDVVTKQCVQQGPTKRYSCARDTRGQCQRLNCI